jgi:DNA-directed RNA polymerase specialized sigma24 family protein
VQAEQARGDRFTDFVEETEPRLRFALAAALGQELGREATAEALAYAWEHWEEIQPMDNPAGYLYRVGRSRGRFRRRRRVFAEVPSNHQPAVEPHLPRAVARLCPEVAELLGISVSAVNAHVQRALSKLRTALGVEIDV